MESAFSVLPSSEHFTSQLSHRCNEVEKQVTCLLKALPVGSSASNNNNSPTPYNGEGAAFSITPQRRPPGPASLTPSPLTLSYKGGNSHPREDPNVILALAIRAKQAISLALLSISSTAAATTPTSSIEVKPPNTAVTNSGGLPNTTVSSSMSTKSVLASLSVSVDRIRAQAERAAYSLGNSPSAEVGGWRASNETPQPDNTTITHTNSISHTLGDEDGEPRTEKRRAILRQRGWSCDGEHRDVSTPTHCPSRGLFNMTTPCHSTRTCGEKLNYGDNVDVSPRKREGPRLEKPFNEDSNAPTGGLSGSRRFHGITIPDSLQSCIQLPEDITSGWDGLYGATDAIGALKQTIEFPKKFPHLFSSGGKGGLRQPWKCILLYGPPGTGKTMLAAAAAKEAGALFMPVSASDLLSKWVGDSEKQVKDIFAFASQRKEKQEENDQEQGSHHVNNGKSGANAKKRSPVFTIIFLDEIDALCGARGTDGESEAARRVKTEFLVRMQRVDPKMAIIVAATNLPWELDSAFRRRFDRLIYVGLPDINARYQFLGDSVNKLNTIPNNDNTLQLTNEEATQSSTSNPFPPFLQAISPQEVREVAMELEGYSGSDIAMVIKHAAMGAIGKLETAKCFYKCTESGLYYPSDNLNILEEAYTHMQKGHEMLEKSHVSLRQSMKSFSGLSKNNKLIGELGLPDHPNKPKSNKDVEMSETKDVNLKTPAKATTGKDSELSTIYSYEEGKRSKTPEIQPLQPLLTHFKMTSSSNFGVSVSVGRSSSVLLHPHISPSSQCDHYLSSQINASGTLFKLHKTGDGREGREGGAGNGTQDREVSPILVYPTHNYTTYREPFYPQKDCFRYCNLDDLSPELVGVPPITKQDLLEAIRSYPRTSSSDEIQRYLDWGKR